MIRHPRTAGFTLIELSIVLVVIGLVAGGVLVGRDMIEAAKARAEVSQLQAFNTAATTFRLKYGHLPGDMPLSKVQQFGFTDPYNWNLCWGQQCTGNGTLECMDSGQANHGFVFGECLYFFIQLAQARLIPGEFTTDAFPSGGRGAGLNFPRSKLYAESAIMPAGGHQLNNGNYLLLNARTSDFWLDNFIYPNTSGDAGLTPSQAFAIDSKMDDGVPATGIVRAVKVQWFAGASGRFLVNDDNGTWDGASTLNCLTSAAGTAYQLTATDRRCVIAYRLQ